VPGVKDCPVEGDRLPLIVISHGGGGYFIGHHDTAEALAEAGFVVAAINHPGDTVSDMSRSDDLSVMIERPTDMKRVIDFMLGESSAVSAIDPELIGFFGFSRGGYTGLVLMGANPDWDYALTGCQRESLHFCEQIRNKDYPLYPLTHDPRIKAAVIIDPVTVFFSAASFASMTAPVQLWRSERGGDGVAPESVDGVDKDLPANHEYRVVPDSGHFAFLSPCWPGLAKMRPELCTDAPGFDRVAFHEQFNARVVAFFRDHLPPR
jgi:predicted dienelactone hydrolase